MQRASEDKQNNLLIYTYLLKNLYLYHVILWRCQILQLKNPPFYAIMILLRLREANYDERRV